MRYRLRTLLILLAAGSLVLAGAWLVMALLFAPGNEPLELAYRYVWSIGSMCAQALPGGICGSALILVGASAAVWLTWRMRKASAESNHADKRTT
jgi:hypothetical protein